MALLTSLPTSPSLATAPSDEASPSNCHGPLSAPTRWVSVGPAACCPRLTDCGVWLRRLFLGPVSVQASVGCGFGSWEHECSACPCGRRTRCLDGLLSPGARSAQCAPASDTVKKGRPGLVALKPQGRLQRDTHAQLWPQYTQVHVRTRKLEVC